MELNTYLLTSGLFFGLANGLSPGPTLVLVISKTLQHNLREGVKAALSPLIFGLVIIPIALLFAVHLSAFKLPLGILSILGAAYILHSSYQLLDAKNYLLKKTNEKPRPSLKTNILINFLSPYAYLFWFGVGSHFLLKAFNSNIASAGLFLISYYVCLVGSKLLLVVILDKTKNLAQNSIYINTLRLLGLALLIFVYIFLKEGLTLIGAL